MPAPEGFRAVDAGSQPAGVIPGVLKAVQGSSKGLPTRVYLAKEYDDKASKAAGVEVWRERVIIGIKSDRFSECAIALEDLDIDKRIELAPLIERFHTQRDSSETDLEGWDVITDSERALLMKLGIQSIDQLAEYPDALIGQMGPIGKGCKEKALRFLTGKRQATEAAERQEEMQLVMEENRRLAAKSDELEQKFMALQAQLAARDEKRDNRDNRRN